MQVFYALLLIYLVQATSLQPLERYFFNNQSLIVVYTVDNDADSRTSFDAMFNAVDSTPALLEMRIIQQFADPANPSGPLNNDTLIGWFMWESVNSWLSRSSIFNDESLTYISEQYFAVTSYFEGCHYCNKVFTELPITAHFSNEQSLGAYNIEATFAVFLAEQTQAEEGTLSYLATNPISSEPTIDIINYTFNRVDFWEMYNDSDSFDYHVYNVNVTLNPEAANWFVDLGSTGTTWYQVLNFTSGCYSCSSTEVTINNNDDDNDDHNDDDDDDDDICISPGAYYFMTIGLSIISAFSLGIAAYALFWRYTKPVSNTISTTFNPSL